MVTAIAIKFRVIGYDGYETEWGRSVYLDFSTSRRQADRYINSLYEDIKEDLGDKGFKVISEEPESKMYYYGSISHPDYRRR